MSVPRNDEVICIDLARTSFCGLSCGQIECNDEREASKAYKEVRGLSMYDYAH